MRITFRLTLTSILLTMLVATVTSIGLVSYLFGRESVESLSHKVTEQTLGRIEQRIDSFLKVAVAISTFGRNLAAAGQVDPRDFPEMQAFFSQAMAVRDELTYLGLGLETGEYCFVERKHDGDLLIRETVRDEQGEWTVRDYTPDGAGRKYLRSREIDDYDLHSRPWYRKGAAAQGPVWTESYTFWSLGDRPWVPGITLATPLRHADGTLLGVMDADFDLLALCRFLQDLQDQLPGYAFVVELRNDGKRFAIAHPDYTKLVQVVAGPRGEKHELVEVAKVGDAHVRAFMERVPASVPRHTGFVPVGFDSGEESWLGGYRMLGTPGAPRWLLGMMLPESAVMADVHRNNRSTLLLGLVGLIGAAYISIVISKRIAGPLKALAADAAAIGRFELDPKPVEHSPILEVDQLLGAVSEMKSGLRSFGKYVPTDLVREVLASGREAELGGERRTLTVFFSDIVGFTSVSERMDPEALVAHVGEYLGAMSEEVLAEDGTLDKYIGDAVMAFWGAPRRDEQHALKACRAALRNQKRLRELRAKWQEEGKPELYCRIGLNTGELIVGNIGSESRLNYTVVGDAANLASRLEGLNSHYGTSIMMSSSTHALVKEAVVARPLDRVAVKGKKRGSLVYELLGLKGETDEEAAAFAQEYEDALACYFVMQWPEAARRFETLLQKRDDTAGRILLERCRIYIESPPPADWTGSFQMTSK